MTSSVVGAPSFQSMEMRDGVVSLEKSKPLLIYADVCIFELDGKLSVFRRISNSGRGYAYVPESLSVEHVLFEASRRPEFGDGESIADILTHTDFKKHLDEFIEKTISPDCTGTPKLFEFSTAAILDLIEIGREKIDPLKMVDLISGRNFFIQAAHWENSKVLKKLVDLFPKDFQTAGKEIIAERLRQCHSSSFLKELVLAFEKGGEKLDPFLKYWVEVAQGVKPDESFKKGFTTLSVQEQQTLYAAAYAYNNPFIYESPQIPIKSNQYSINLMWINAYPMTKEQPFLLGIGETFQEQEEDFRRRFVTPISDWARVNPETLINIWIDSAMATPEAIEKSRNVLQQALGETARDFVRFKDVRSLEIVSLNRAVFSHNLPVYFRVDLLRAIAADHTLKQEEAQYFVYGDLDMPPLSGEELFDRKTLCFLDEYGVVFAKGGILGFENGFFILNGSHSQCMKSHRTVVIDLNVQMALEKPRAISPQQIYDTYPAMLTHLLDADGRYGKFTLGQARASSKMPKEQWFRYDRFRTAAHLTLPLEGSNIELREIAPTKPVLLPSSHF